MSGSALSDLTASYLDLRWHLDPVAASEAGLAAHDARLGRFDGDAIRAHLAALKSIMGALEEIQLEDLADEIDRTAVLNDVRCAINRFTVERPHERNPAFWVSHVLEGLYQMLALRDRSPEARARAAAGRLREIPAFLEAAPATLRDCPAPMVALAEEVAAGGRLLLDELATALRPPEEDEYDRLLEDARAAITTFERYLADRLQPEAEQHAFAVGEAAFDFRLHFEHALREGASELWRYGQTLMAEVEGDLERLADTIAPGCAWRDLMDRLRADHPSGDGLVAAYAADMERARTFVEERGLVPVPEGRLAVIATPPFVRPLVPFAAYQAPGAFSPDRTGWFYVSPPGPAMSADLTERLLRDHCTHEIAATAVHEGYPGHHLQFLSAHAQSRTARQVLAAPITVEGWALYCEDMMGEEGFYRTPEERFFQRVALYWRAVRIVLDIGLHVRGMGFAEAVDLLVDKVRFDRANAEAEVRRYCATPGYQLAYAVGRRELRRLRSDFRDGVGGTDTLRRFHEAVLAYGGLPISLMRWGLGLADG